ncbi:MAG: NTP transferase domain-containing protein [Caulobacter sp.]|nr:NTP transferase domain-containing protein [Caulobacter sp.]
MSGQCVILVGGLGMRLGGLAARTPKPLLPVQGRPFLEWLLLKAARHDFRHVLLLAGHGADVLDEWLWESHVADRLGLTLSVNREASPLGTAGALVDARALLEEQFLLVNGDTWFDFDWSALALGEDADGCVALRRVSPADRYETIALDGERVSAVRPRDPSLAEGLINGGVYRLRASALDGVAMPASLEQEVLPRLTAAGRLDGRVFDAAFLDIGLPDSYRAAGALSLPGTPA